MIPLKVTYTPEQQAATEARITEAFAGLLSQLRAVVPALAWAARFDEELRRAATRTVTPLQ
ncbi:hypothetical protein [Streptomyces sp. H27-C3]|uniref:hypothetical protein n=1 Tax=Streptomyces sp. H27-C3 TaxID=3046305 RepID=UPI0024BBBCB6|nr:hypothetical protein [Streptomyces sp. H27-C3]MDJ0460602.1 hypothetical protein [Streptomyces sp. H27-C3]